MEKDLTETLRAEMFKLKSGVTCWGFAAGKGTGSMVALNFGDKVQRRKPVGNSTLSKEVREYSAEYTLYLEECAWRIQSDFEVIASSLSSNKPSGVMLKALKQLVGKKVENVEVEEVSFDLKIEFEGRMNLTVFCLSKSDEGFDNYTFFTSDYLYVVTSEHNLMIEQRAE